MNTRAIRPRRKREGRGSPSSARGASRAPARDEPADASIDVARYIADMTVQLASMARAAKLELLAYFLNMANAESESIVRGSVDGRPV
jgi:hypothetical protein